MTPSLESFPARTAYINLIKVHERLEGEFAELFRQSGLTISQFNVLRILITGSEDGVSCQEIGSELLNRVPDVTRLVDRMERDGLVKRERCSEDRRVVRIKLAAKGRKLCESLHEPVKKLHRRQFRDLSPAQIEGLNAGLVALLGDR